MSSQTIKEIARWSGIALTGGFALCVSYSLFRGLIDLWFRRQGEPYFGTLFILAIFAFVVLPVLWVMHGLLRRDYFEVINALSTVVAIIVIVSFYPLLKATGLHGWLIHFDAGDNQSTLGSLALSSIRLVLNLLCIVAPFSLAGVTRRLGNRLARRYLHAAPMPIRAIPRPIS